jgi:hypothetical protein
MPQVHYLGERPLDEADRFDGSERVLFDRMPASQTELRRYCGDECDPADADPTILPLGRGARALVWHGLYSLFVATFLVLLHGGAHAQQRSADNGLVWAEESGAASFYGRAHQGRRTASGARFDENELTAAHPWLPFGTKVLVTVQGTGRAVIVTITDRLYSRRRVIDLSTAAARVLGIIRQGVATVSLGPA